MQGNTPPTTCTWCVRLLSCLQGMELTPQQKCSLHALWSRTKSMKAPLVQQHEALLGKLEGLQQEQRAQQQLFAQQAQQLPIKRACEALAKQRQGRASSTTMLPPPPPLPPQPQPSGQETAKLSTGGERDQPAAPAAQTRPASEGTISTSTFQQPQPQQVQQQQQQQQQRAPLLLEPPLHQDPAAELLLAVPCATQRHIAARLSVLRDQLTMHEKLIVTLLWNMLSKKQFAATVVGSWPFMPDAHKVGWWQHPGITLCCGVAVLRFGGISSAVLPVEQCTVAHQHRNATVACCCFDGTK